MATTDRNLDAPKENVSPQKPVREILPRASKKPKHSDVAHVPRRTDLPPRRCTSAAQSNAAQNPALIPYSSSIAVAFKTDRSHPTAAKGTTRSRKTRSKRDRPLVVTPEPNEDDSYHKQDSCLSTNLVQQKSLLALLVLKNGKMLRVVTQEPLALQPALLATGACTFPETVYKMLEENSRKHNAAVYWTHGGEAFCMKTSSHKLASVLNNYFEHSNHTSLQRQLNMYGWKKHVAGRYKGCFYNPFFHRNKPEDMRLIKRNAPPKKRKSGSRMSSIAKVATTAKVCHLKARKPTPAKSNHPSQMTSVSDSSSEKKPCFEIRPVDESSLETTTSRVVKIPKPSVWERVAQRRNASKGLRLSKTSESSSTASGRRLRAKDLHRLALSLQCDSQTRSRTLPTSSAESSSASVTSMSSRVISQPGGDTWTNVSSSKTTVSAGEAELDRGSPVEQGTACGVTLEKGTLAASPFFARVDSAIDILASIAASVDSRNDSRVPVTSRADIPDDPPQAPVVASLGVAHSGRKRAVARASVSDGSQAPTVTMVGVTENDRAPAAASVGVVDNARALTVARADVAGDSQVSAIENAGVTNGARVPIVTKADPNGQDRANMQSASVARIPIQQTGNLDSEDALELHLADVSRDLQGGNPFVDRASVASSSPFSPITFRIGGEFEVTQHCLTSFQDDWKLFEDDAIFKDPHLAGQDLATKESTTTDAVTPPRSPAGLKDGSEYPGFPPKSAPFQITSPVRQGMTANSFTSTHYQGSPTYSSDQKGSPTSDIQSLVHDEQNGRSLWRSLPTLSRTQCIKPVPIRAAATRHGFPSGSVSAAPSGSVSAASHSCRLEAQVRSKTGFHMPHHRQMAHIPPLGYAPQFLDRIGAPSQCLSFLSSPTWNGSFHQPTQTETLGRPSHAPMSIFPSASTAFAPPQTHPTRIRGSPRGALEAEFFAEAGVPETTTAGQNKASLPI